MLTSRRRRPRPALTVDVVVLANSGDRPRVLLIRRRKPPYEGRWALPGGFVQPDEPLETAARRELIEETGVQPALLQQLHTFGDPGRDPRGWTVTVVFLAYLGTDDLQELPTQAGSDAKQVAWFHVNHLPELAFDHADILSHALRRVQTLSSIA